MRDENISDKKNASSTFQCRCVFYDDINDYLTNFAVPEFVLTI